MIGTKLAHYEITGHLGSGGMGDVYQATDSKLGREREARVLASLNHSNIAVIHDLQEENGIRSHGFMRSKPEYGDTMKRTFDYVDNWLSDAKKFGTH